MLGTIKSQAHLVKETKDKKTLLKVFNFFISLAIVVLGVLQYVFGYKTTFHFPFPVFLLPACLAFFGILMIAGQIQYSWLEEYCNFLTDTLGRGVFTFYCGTLCFFFSAWDSYIQDSAIGSILSFLYEVAGFSLIGIGCIYIVMGSLERKQNKKSEAQAELDSSIADIRA